MKKIYLWTAFVTVLIFSQPVLADSPKKGIEVNPAFIEMSLEKNGERQSSEITYTNFTDSPIHLEVSAFDYVQSSVKGRLNFYNKETSSVYPLASYLNFDQKSLDIAPQQKTKINVTVKNDSQLSPGGHYAAVVATVTTLEKENNLVYPSISTLVSLKKVNGAAFALQLEKLSWSGNFSFFSHPQSVDLLFKNNGNIHLIPYGVVLEKDMLGRTVYKGVINTSSESIFPRTEKKLTVNLYPVNMLLPISWNTVIVSGNDSLHKVAYQATISVFFIHPWLILGALLVVGGALFLYKKWKNAK